ncbi:MAG: 5'/3'-nucleotidase SurE [Psychromonas sp.]|nr:5'/3'-nucleotidase SurE [Psychromonas sp.]
MILLSNDDGVFAKGLSILSDTLARIDDIEVYAPENNRSGVSNAITLENPLRVQKLNNGFNSVSGTPTDCVHLALNKLCKVQPQLVVSGINEGANLGDDVLYSGTIAAAIEGRFLALPAVAVSLVGKKHFESAARYAEIIVKKLINEPLQSHQVLNINVPDLPFDEIKGIKVTRLGKRHPANKIIKAVDPRDREMFWIGPSGEVNDDSEGTDFHAIKQDYVSITPLKIDLTAIDQIQIVYDWLDLE